ncbi:MAG TPA: hypothetical protein VN788_00175 [Verrucomicrobiae bacterium]|nr:hypothetical protein [Verrucomicrobiae bacterium]
MSVLSMVPLIGSAAQLATPDTMSQANLIAAQLRQANSRLIALEQSLITNMGNQDYQNQLRPGVNTARARYEKILNAYIYTYGAVFGNPPDTTGLEQWAIYIGAGIIALGTLLAAAYEINKYIDVLQEQQSNITLSAQNTAYAEQQCHAAQAAGDTDGANRWCAVAQSSAASTAQKSGFTEWLSENWAWVALGAAGALILPDFL